MPARTGQQYIEALRKMKPTIYLDGRLVKDVTEEPVFTRPGKMKLQAQVYLTYELADLGRFTVTPEISLSAAELPVLPTPVPPIQMMFWLWVM